VNKILLTVAFLAAVLNAASPDPRAGLWQTSAVIDGVSQKLRLTIETHAPIADGEPTVSPIRGLGPSDCDVETSLELTQFRISFRCARNDGTAHDFEGTFDTDYQGINGTWHLWDKKEVVVRYQRPPKVSSNPFSGDWVATGPSRKCVFHVYEGPAAEHATLPPDWRPGVIDVFSTDEERGWFGMDIDIWDQSDGMILVVAYHLGAQFVGKFDLEGGTFSGGWLGFDPGCEEQGSTVVFKRVSSN
jgi:hypothetical protein